MGNISKTREGASGIKDSRKKNQTYPFEKYHAV